jgi:hypothetical protein
MMNCKTSVVGEKFLELYKIGDIVKFCGDDFGDSLELKTGIILNIFVITLSGREFPHAKIYVLGDDKRELVLLGNLTLLYKVCD